MAVLESLACRRMVDDSSSKVPQVEGFCFSGSHAGMKTPGDKILEVGVGLPAHR